MPVKQYRKKPVVISAIQLTWENWERGLVRDFIDNEYLGNFYAIPQEGYINSRILIQEIKTLEGVMKAKEGDWIIKGVNDEFYPCANDIFLKTYEEVKQEK